MSTFGSDAIRVGGRTGMDTTAEAATAFGAERTGGNVAAFFNAHSDTASDATASGGHGEVVLGAHSAFTGHEDGDYYKYRHFCGTAATRYNVELRDRMGRIKWADDYSNLVCTAGLTHLVDCAFKTGSGGTPAWFIGLVDGAGSPAYDAADTSASHAGWSENTGYSEDGRPTFVPGDVANGSVDNTVSRATYSISADGVIAGSFLANSGTKSATRDVIWGVGAFTGGPRPVENGDTLRVTCTVSIS